MEQTAAQPVVDWNPETIGKGADFTRFIVLAGIIRSIKPGGTLLDIGCGVGDLRPLVPTHRYTGIDPHSQALRTAMNRHPSDRFVCENSETWKPDQQFDVVVFNESLYYLSNPLAALMKYTEALNRGGIMALSIFRKGGWVNPATLALHDTKNHIRENMTLLRELAIKEGKLTWDIFIARH
jgi:trans-aconitate methyltransferase